MLALLDNTVLSNFAIVSRVDLLHAAIENAATVPQVLDEFHAGVLSGRIPPVDWSWLSVLSLTSEEQALFAKIALHLNKGEAACSGCCHTARWAASIVYALGQVNFLFDKSQSPYLSRNDLSGACRAGWTRI
jgi:hypothetical protein